MDPPPADLVGHLLAPVPTLRDGVDVFLYLLLWPLAVIPVHAAAKAVTAGLCGLGVTAAWVAAVAFWGAVACCGVVACGMVGLLVLLWHRGFR